MLAILYITYLHFSVLFIIIRKIGRESEFKLLNKLNYFIVNSEKTLLTPG